MDVSDRDKSTSTSPLGDELISTVVSLTGLPAPLMQQELQNILESAGQKTSDLTIEDLRAAMLTYLESLQSEIENADQLTSL
jgi:hypothetical protein